MRIYPAPHYAMGGLWVDYNLMTTVPGLYAIGEANFSDHGANRLGASAMMQCLADGYFILPVTIADYLSRHPAGEVKAGDAGFREAEQAVRERTRRLVSVNGKRTVLSFHRELGRLMIDKCGISRTRQGLEEALRALPALRDEFWRDVKVPGGEGELNPSLEHAGRVADFLDFAELMCRDALARDESCGCHFREEHQTEDGETKRDDDRFAHVSVWEFQGDGQAPREHREPLAFEAIPLATRNYKT
jgi:succinate dehydrogenase / fumarate reductase flavoprotein subunit